jgi:homeodomain-containing protein
MEKYRVSLTAEERFGLEQLVSAGKAAARRLVHARILLLADSRVSDETDEAIVDALGCSPRTVSRVRQQFVTCGLDAAVSRRLQPARPDKVKIKGDVEQRLVTLACSDPPKGRCHWTLRLLGDELVTLGLVERISTETVRQALKKTTSSRGSSRRGVSRPMRTPNSSGAWKM